MRRCSNLVGFHKELLNFGKHKGKHISQVNDGYLLWMLKNFPDSSPWYKLAANTLITRGTNKEQEGNSDTLLAELNSCSSKRDLQWARTIHNKAVQSGDDKNIHVVSGLIKIYAKCGSMEYARSVFESVPKPSVVCWNVLLQGYAENGQGLTALELFSRMKSSGYVPNRATYIFSLKACTSLAVNGDASGKSDGLEQGKKIHTEVGSHLNPYVQSTLIDMYCKCGSVVDARQVFESIENPDVVSWNTMILGYVDNGDAPTALKLFGRVKTAGCKPDSVTYISVLKACAALAMNADASGKRAILKYGREIHLDDNFHSIPNVKSTLLDMYAKCGSMVHARSLFDSIENPDVVSWTALLLGYADNGECHVALDMFFEMKKRGCVPNSVTYIAALKACGSIGALDIGRRFHLEEMKEFPAYVVTCLVDFYAKCGSINEAREVFYSHPNTREVSTWNALLAGYSNFDSFSAFNHFEAMQDGGYQPDGVTFVCMLLCCSHAGVVEKAKEYFEAMHRIYRVTPTVRHYSCMVDVLGRANQLNEAIVVLQKMPCNRDSIIWRAFLGACCKWKNIEIGNLAFRSLVDIGELDASAYVMMFQMYGRGGLWEEQERLLCAIPPVRIASQY